MKKNDLQIEGQYIDQIKAGDRLIFAHYKKDFNKVNFVTYFKLKKKLP